MKQYGWNDIAYNFLVGGDGNVYEGRGYDIEGAHTLNYNSKSLGVALVGDFSHKSPTQGQIDATLKFLELAVRENKLASNYKLVGQRQVVMTASPGDKAYNIIKTWDHWSESL